MGKSHRDDFKARKKAKRRGQNPWVKKDNRRKEHYVGPWEVKFNCCEEEHIPHASSGEIAEVAKKQHSCIYRNCKPTKFRRLA